MPGTTVTEIRMHGRGGQGAVIASRLLATAAFLEDKGVQTFPTFGVERRGAPVAAFVRIGTSRIRDRSGAMKPHHVVVLDPSLLDAVDVFAGLRADGTVLVNAPQPPSIRRDGAAVAWIDASAIAVRRGLGTRATPIINTAILGAFARVTGVVKLESVLEAIRRGVSTKLEENLAAARDAYESAAVVPPGKATA
ncbi:MAG: 2-oxoacid:acceptor oxidoreductase family protein [Planctomycetes bacterium]|nr:2-oxoacid:acceptor oxidoreductase family protein [Planctomycetota bacterium]